ncbi:hypothetical protein [Ulvibacterium sp.]|uniref:hypothetical protein n=1 Tax=Ulvibacterium sp. TaxID=2665914 RepID=UPI00262E09DE|nr:hypothetical protein [Ulvibacterium sp.]
MEKQYCRVGTVTPLTPGRKAITLLEYQYQNFMNKASMEYADSRLSEFFEQKALKIKKTLESLMQ